MTEHKCPDCGQGMKPWLNGIHPEGGTEPRLKCSQCGRWVWERDLEGNE